MQRTIPNLICFVLLLTPFSAWAEDVHFAHDKLSIVTHKETIPFTIEIAKSEAEQEYGLMFRTNIPDRTGMIFDVGAPRHIDMWMKNTLVPLDMIFIDAHGNITQIAANAKPESLDIISSQADARAVLEVAGGAAQQYHIAPGDKVLYSIFP